MAQRGGYNLLHLLSATLRPDDTERKGAMGLRLPAVRIDVKGRFVQVTEGEDKTDGVLRHRFRNADTAMLSGEKYPRKDMPDITHTSGDAYQKIRLFSGGKQIDQLKNSNTQTQSCTR